MFFNLLVQVVYHKTISRMCLITCSSLVHYLCNTAKGDDGTATGNPTLRGKKTIEFVNKYLHLVFSLISLL